MSLLRLGYHFLLAFAKLPAELPAKYIQQYAEQREGKQRSIDQVGYILFDHILIQSSHPITLLAEASVACKRMTM